MGRLLEKLVQMRGDWIGAPQSGGPQDILIEGCIHGVLASKSNSRRINRFGGPGGRLVIVQEQAALDFTEYVLNSADVARDKGKIQGPLAGALRIEVLVYQANLMRDLDVELLCDALQKAGVIRNDRSFWIKISVRQIDKENPRVEFRIRSCPDDYLAQIAAPLRVQAQP